MSAFAVVPIELVLDHRLTLIQTRVLIALISHMSKKNGSIVWPKRSTLAEECGYGPKKITEATTALASYGWLKKTGNGGKSRPVEYQIIVPDFTPKRSPNQGGLDVPQTVPESGGVCTLLNGPRIGGSPNQGRVPDSGGGGVPDSGGGGVPDSGGGKEQSIELSIEQSTLSWGQSCFDEKTQQKSGTKITPKKKTPAKRVNGQSYAATADSILRFLNEKTGKAFRARNPDGSMTANGKLVVNLLRKGYGEQQCRHVIARKARDWTMPDKRDRMESYLRPSTLFRPSNFETYIGECV